jgi:hypothetical protein
MAQLRDIKVVIRTPEGLFLRIGEKDWELTPFRARATVLDYLSEEVEQQLALIRKIYGTDLEAVPIPEQEVQETCDSCQQTIESVAAYFNGSQFLCGSCRIL